MLAMIAVRYGIVGIFLKLCERPCAFAWLF